MYDTIAASILNVIFNLARSNLFSCHIHHGVDVHDKLSL